jgi:hypothetical protein
MPAARQPEPVIAEDCAAEQLQIIIAKLERIKVGQQRIEAGQAELRAGQAELRARQAELRELIRRGAPDQSNNQKNRGGRAPQYSWDTVRLAILGHANLNRFDTRVELLKFTNDFIAQWPQQPTDRAIREFLRPLAEAMGLV